MKNNLSFAQFRPLVYGTLALLAGVSQLPAQAPYGVTVKAGPLRQTFYGFGISQGTGWNTTSAGPRNTMADLAYRDLKTRVFRIWLPCSQDETVATMLQNFNTHFVASGAISDIKSRGVSTLLLAPGRSYYSGWETPPTESMSAYTSRLAEVILQIKNTYGITIDATGLANEPGVWPISMIVEGVKELRANLDARGLSSVKIVPPECNSHSNSVPRVDALKADAVAWNSLFAISSHSYGGVMDNNDMEVRKQGKEWWMTEASDDGQEFPEDENRACSIVARMLCELNHGVSQWSFFLGVGERPDVNTAFGTTGFLMLYDQATARIVTFLKYYYFKQVLHTIDVGARFRKCVSATEGDMFRVNLQNPAINAAAACNPDGSWGIAVVNGTGVVGSPAGPQNFFHPAASYNVTVNVEELASLPAMTFTLYRSRANQHFVNSGTVTMVNGQVSFPIAARELVSLRSASTPLALPVTPTGLAASTFNAPVALNWNNTVGAASWNVKRATTSGGPYTSIATTTDTHYADQTAVEGGNYYYVISAVNALGESANSAEVWGSPAPHTWANVDIGAVGLAGSYKLSDEGTFEVKGAGTSESSASASFNFTFRTMTGDGSFIARLAKGTQGQNSRFGILMAEALNSSPRAVGMFYNFNGAWLRTFMWNRVTAGSAGLAYDLGPNGVPTWFKLTRSGNTFTGYRSQNGTSWSAINTATVAMPGTIFVGLTACSSSTNFLATGLYDNVGAPPEAPTGLTKTVNATNVQIRWTASHGATSYKVKRASGSAPYTTIATVNVPTLNYTDTVMDGINYSYVVSAVNALGESPDSSSNYVRPGILWERWTNITGGINSLPLNTPPASITSLDRLESPSNIGDLYGDRVRGYITAPTTGAYTFWIAGDNACQFFLSPSMDPAAKVLQARVESYTGARQWNVFSYQKSASINLVAGQKYYFETLHSEGNGGDCLAVGWSKPGESTTVPSEVVPRSALTPYRGVVREVWTDLPSGNVTTIPLDKVPNSQAYLTSLEGPTNAGENYGDRVRGYITAPESGYYTFWIAGDNDCKFYLSPGTNPAEKVLRASVPFYTAPRAWSTTPEQKSAPVILIAGERYYFEILHKEGAGGDCMAVGWAKPGQLTSAPSEIVPYEVLSPY